MLNATAGRERDGEQPRGVVEHAAAAQQPAPGRVGQLGARGGTATATARSTAPPPTVRARPSSASKPPEPVSPAAQ